MIRHHKARRLALQGLCCLDSQGPEARDLVEAFIVDSRDGKETVDAAGKLLDAVSSGLPQVDEVLARHARHWDLSRLALVDRNILRLGAWELLQGQVSPKIAISEAVKLAKEFSTSESPRFVNGVLDAVGQEIRQNTAREPR